MTTLDIIYIRDLKKMLPYQDSRSICAYCRQHNIKVLGSNHRRYVLSIQWKRAQLTEKINHLKAIYGNAWIEILKSEMNLYAKYQSILDEIKKERSNAPVKQSIKPKGKAEQKFLLDIKKIVS